MEPECVTLKSFNIWFARDDRPSATYRLHRRAPDKETARESAEEELQGKYPNGYRILVVRELT